MTKPIILTLLGLTLVIGALAGIKFLQIRHMIDVGEKMTPPPETITACPAQDQSWESSLTATATVDAVQGVSIAAEQAGKVVRISFNAGDMVQKGAQLVQLDTSAEEAQLRAMESSRDLARLNLKRLSQLADQGLIARSQFDTAEADFKQAEAQAENIRAIIDRKIIRAPFSGRLGIRRINPGQILKEGEEIVTLQTLDPVFVNFMLPQQELARVATGMTVRVRVDGRQESSLAGTITAIDPKVDDITRNIRVQATLANTDEILRPGMFVDVAVIMPQPEQVVAIPGTAILYAPYGDSVFVVEDRKDEKDGAGTRTLRQQFVRTGDKRGDYAAIVSGLKAGEVVASTGVFKLRNGQNVVVDNRHAPPFDLDPRVENN